MSDSETRLLMLIDDEPAQCRLISALAAREGWRTLVVRDSETAIATLGTRQGMQLAAIILDQWVPGDDACALIAELKSRRPAVPILMLTTSASPLLAVEAMRAGATDYLIKPVAPDRLMTALRSATTREAPRAELQPLTDVADAINAERAKFWMLHSAYMGCEAIKYGVGIVLLVMALRRSRSVDPVNKFDMIDKANHRHVNW